jgi:uncharacterized 2Fe-2S/4Fe-4S cluster protein (DUF4445 family)
MTTLVRSAINELLMSVIEQAHVATSHVLELTLVGNPVMHHLLLGLTRYHWVRHLSPWPPITRLRSLRAHWDQDEISLIIDVGTNAEIILGNRERLLVASSPTGPAFEGAQISNG